MCRELIDSRRSTQFERCTRMTIDQIDQWYMLVAHHRMRAVAIPGLGRIDDREIQVAEPGAVRTCFAARVDLDHPVSIALRDVDRVVLGVVVAGAVVLRA